jgi:hypothetical protein
LHSAAMPALRVNAKHMTVLLQQLLAASDSYSGGL